MNPGEIVFNGQLFAAIPIALLAGLVSFAEIPALMRNDCVFEPDESHRATYDELFDVYQDLHKALAPVYKRLNR